MSKKLSCDVLILLDSKRCLIATKNQEGIQRGKKKEIALYCKIVHMKVQLVRKSCSIGELSESREKGGEVQ